jgi:hypothetical protein
MEAATPLHRPHVRVVGDAVLADGLVVRDERAVRLATESGDPESVLLDAIEIGARVLEREGTEAHAEVVKAEFEALKGSFTDYAKRLSERLDEKVVQAFGADDGEVAKVMARHFGDESSTAVQHRVKAVLVEASQQMREDLRRQLLAEGDDNPLAKFHQTQIAVAKQIASSHTEHLARVDQRLEAMRLEVEKLRAEKEKLEELAVERERGTAKGRVFEEALVEVLDGIAHAQGDECEATGDQTEAAGKVGDAVVTIDGCAGHGRGRIVFEAKNKKLSRNEMVRELDAAMAERRADFGVLVVAGADKLPARTCELREMQGDKMVVAWDPEEGTDLPLRVAYSLARARVLLQRADAEGIDGEAIRACCERALQAMAEVQRIKQQLTASKTAIDTARDLVDGLAGTVKGHLAQIEALVAAAGADGDQLRLAG